MAGQSQSGNQNGSLQGGSIPPEQVRAIIDEAGKHYHVIGAMSFGEIPVGHSVVRNFLRANPDPKAGDVYDVGMGKFGLTGNFLNALADAAGVSVIGSNMLVYQANYCVVATTVARMGLDGTVRRVERRKVMDLREGSGQLKAMRDAAKAKNKDAETQVREQRLRIAEHADSKAALRAIRAILSVRTYTAEELKKPFAVFKLQFTGKTDDPQLRQIAFIGLMQASLGGHAALFGNPVGGFAPPHAPMLGGGVAPMLGGGAPLLGAGAGAPGDLGGDDDDDIPMGGDRGGAPAAPVRAAAGDPERIKIPGKSGHTVYQAKDEDLLYWEKRQRGELQSGKWEGSQYAEKNLVQLLTIRAELRFRKLAVEPCPALDGDVQAAAGAANGGAAGAANGGAAGAAGAAGAPTQDRPSGGAARGAGAETTPFDGEHDEHDDDR